MCINGSFNLVRIEIWETLRELSKSSKDISLHRLETCGGRNLDILFLGESTEPCLNLLNIALTFISDYAHVRI